MRESDNFPRQSLSCLNQNDDRELRIFLLSSVKINDVTHYRVAGRFTSSGQTWEVHRRYSEFLALRDRLVKFFSTSNDTCPGCLNYLHAIQRFDFPKKHIFASKSQMVINYRIKALRSFMNLLASWSFSNTPKCPTCGGYAFEIVRNFVLDGSDAVDGSDMNYIRESFVVDAFSGHERASATYNRGSVQRRHSWIPESNSAVLNSRQPRSQPRQAPSDRPSRRQMQNTDAYDAFNDYLPAPPSQQKKVGLAKGVGGGGENGKFSSRSQIAEAQERAKAAREEAARRAANGSQGSFRFYNDDAGSDKSRASTAGTTSSRAPPSQVRKQKSMPAPSQYRQQKSMPPAPPQQPVVADRSLGDSFLSAATSTNSPSSTSGAREFDLIPVYKSPHDHQKTPRKQAKASAALYDSFISDSTSTGAEQTTGGRRYEDDQSDTLDYSEDEIDITGVALDEKPTRKTRPKSTSGENLWQPWELARVG